LEPSDCETKEVSSQTVLENSIIARVTIDFCSFYNGSEHALVPNRIGKLAVFLKISCPGISSPLEGLVFVENSESIQAV
jgi:hypothetical protein